MEEPAQTEPLARHKLVHGSVEELLSFERGSVISALPLSYLVKIMEEYDPGGRRSHAIAAKYRRS